MTKPPLTQGKLLRLIASVSVLWCGYLSAATFATKTYLITITERCKEGAVGCDRVDYLGINRKNNESIRLRGKY